MSNDVFIKIDGIMGESQDATHPNEIEVINWTWKMAQRLSIVSETGSGVGSASVDDLVFFHNVDRASPSLMSYCLTGTHVSKAVLTMRRAGGSPLDFLRLTMSDVFITGVEMTAQHELVRLSFARIKQEYIVQNAQGGSNGVVTGIFDIRANRAVSR